MTLGRINLKIDQDLKQEAEEIIKSNGTNMSNAVRLFLSSVVRQGRLTFEIPKQPNYIKLEEEILIQDGSYYTSVWNLISLDDSINELNVATLKVSKYESFAAKIGDTNDKTISFNLKLSFSKEEGNGLLMAYIISKTVANILSVHAAAEESIEINLISNDLDDADLLELLPRKYLLLDGAAYYQLFEPGLRAYYCNLYTSLTEVYSQRLKEDLIPSA